MENVKPLQRFFEPDARHHLFSVMETPLAQLRATSLDDLYGDLSGLDLKYRKSKNLCSRDECQFGRRVSGRLSLSGESRMGSWVEEPELRRFLRRRRISGIVALGGVRGIFCRIILRCL
jgi:hypothetical protein